MEDQYLTFNQWFQELEEYISNEGYTISGLDQEAWREYYERDLTPKEAWHTDLSYA